VHIPLPFHETTTTSAVTTGELPTPEVVESLLAEVFERYRSVTEGAVADYIPALAETDPSLFGVSGPSAWDASGSAAPPVKPPTPASWPTPWRRAPVISSMADPRSNCRGTALRCPASYEARRQFG
jgi:hypothetical protein